VYSASAGSFPNWGAEFQGKDGGEEEWLFHSCAEFSVSKERIHMYK
jgi:hypothetical protein